MLDAIIYMVTKSAQRDRKPSRTRPGTAFGVALQALRVMAVLLLAAIPGPVLAQAAETSLFQSVEQALRSHPQLQALAHHNQALQWDLEQAKGGYRPSADVVFGYGLEQFSDESTREEEADPSDDDIDPLTRASLSIKQKLYSGGKTGQQVSIQGALLETANHRLVAAELAIALDAVIAHLNVFWRQELVSLAERNLKVHRNIHQYLVEREQAGVGNIADVSQAQARLARAEANLYRVQAELSQSIASYTQVIGTAPGELTYAGTPGDMPPSLATALKQTQTRHPDLLALDAEMEEAGARLALARANYKPEIDMELNSRYSDQAEGDTSWQNTNEAMVLFKWNLYDGGKDKAGVNAAMSRKNQSQSQKETRWIELKEATSAAWTNYQAYQRQRVANSQALDYSRKTFEAYLSQFSISQRSLLDVLIVENDFFQSAVQLANVYKNEIIAAYRILALTANLQVSPCPKACQHSSDYTKLTQALILPPLSQLLSSPPPAEPSLAPPDPPRADATAPEPVASDTTQPAETKAPKKKMDVDRPPKPADWSVAIGPCVSPAEIRRVQKILEEKGVSSRQQPGTGPVKMIRLQDGVYSKSKVFKRLAYLKKAAGAAFALKQNGQWALYVGSYHDPEQARLYAAALEEKQIPVTQVETRVEMKGQMLIVDPVPQKTAEAIASQMTDFGIATKIEPIGPIEPPVTQRDPAEKVLSGQGPYPWLVWTRLDLSNIRSSPDGHAAIQMRVKSKTPLQVTGEKGMWLRLQLRDGSEGWIHRALVTDRQMTEKNEPAVSDQHTAPGDASGGRPEKPQTPAKNSAYLPKETNDAATMVAQGPFPRTVTTRPELSNIRSSPEDHAAIQMRVKSETPLQVTGEKGVWLRLQLRDGSEGWIHRALVANHAVQ